MSLIHFYRSKLGRNILFLITLTTIVKHYYVIKYWSFSNDDVAYFTLADNLRLSSSFTLDGQTPQTHFPPGYPLIIALESLILPSRISIIYCNYILGSLLISLISILILRELRIELPLSSLVLLFFNPVTFFGIATLNISAEIPSTILILTSLLFILKFSKTHNLFFWFISCICLGFAYLCREELLCLVVWHITLLVLYQKQRKNIVPNMFYLLVISLIVTVMPYVVFLYRELGILTLTGKLSSSDTTFDDRWGEVDLVQGAFETLMTFFASPLFNAPTLTIFFFIALVLSLQTNKRGKHFKYIGFIFLLPFCTLFPLYTVTNALGRSMFFLIFLYFISFVILERSVFLWQGNKSFLKNTISWIICSTFIITLASVEVLNIVDRTPHSISQIGQWIANDQTSSGARQSIKVYSRGVSIAATDEHFEVCKILENCKSVAYYVLSSSKHVSMTTLGSEEDLAVKLDETFFRGCQRRLKKSEPWGEFVVFRC